MKAKFILFLILLSLSFNGFAIEKTGVRKIINLNGQWDIAESKTTQLPEKYNNTVVVPGLVDMAQISFDSVGYKYSKRSFYNYHRTFEAPSVLPAKVILKIHKAMYGSRVYLNGNEVGYNPYCFTPGYFDIRKFIKLGKLNDITIQIGAYIDNLPDSVPNGYDFEKLRYISGIYDNVEIITAGFPYIENIQIAPDIRKQTIRIVAEIESDKDISDYRLNYKVTEYKSGKVVISGLSGNQFLKKGINKIDFIVPIKSCKLWTPESPFLYKLSLNTGGDCKTERFGMRSFRFDKDKKVAVLNDKPYAMLGTNTCIHRFFEDSTRNGLPWDKKWVKKLHAKFKDMNWNSIRYTIGFPPEQWYEIADETGLLIQDEYPLWYAFTPFKFTESAFYTEYIRWMRERWNHPSVVIWDAQNETTTLLTGQALNKVRGLDLSNRPWDNGFAAPMSDTDCIESHPYLFMQYHQLNGQHKVEPEKGFMKEFYDTIRTPDNDPNQWTPLKHGRYENPIIINEYDWLWINRDGTPTTLTDGVYKTLFQLDSLTEKQIRIVHAENIGVLTEYWRCHRAAAAILHFCGLGYSRSSSPRGQTSDNFVNIEKLEYDPFFYNLVRNKFAPLSIMIDKWDKSYSYGELTVPVYIVNDLPADWEGNMILSLKTRGKVIQKHVIKTKVEAFGREIKKFKLNLDSNFKKGEEYEMVSEIKYNNEKISSIRKFKMQ